MTTEQGQSTRTPTDWIESFLDYTEGIASPPIFRLWAGIGAIAGVLERRVWVESAGEVLFPNLYTLFVAPPGVGKTQAIKVTKALWKQVPDLILSPDNMTKAALVDSLQRAARKIVVSPTELLEFNSMQVAADELGVFMSQHDLEFLSFLNNVYENPPFYQEARRMFGNKPLDIPAPQLNILAGTQPGFLASVFPEEAWTMGFTSRLIMLYCSIPVRVPLFETRAKAPEKEKGLVLGLKAMMKLHGPFKFTPEAKGLLQGWETKGRPPVPQHSKLEHYNARRILHMLKLCQISAVSRGSGMIIGEVDFNRSLAWMVEAERTMPDVFRNMTQKSDAQVITELHFFAWQLWAKKKAGIHESLLIHFLQTKVPSDKVMKVLEIAERANVLVREVNTNLYRPTPKDQLGLE